MRFVRLELSGRYREIGPQVKGALGASMDRSFRLDHFLERVARIERSRSTQRVLVERVEDFAAPPFAALEEIRRELRRLVDAGKHVVYFSPSYEAFDCYLASACSRRVIHPLGTLTFEGLSRNGLFFKKLLRKHRIGVEIVRRGRYKSAGDPLRTSEYDSYSREQLQAVLDGTVDALRAAVSQSPGFSEALLDELLNGRILTANEARDDGLVDECRTANDLISSWKSKEKVKETSIKRVRGRFGSGARIAVLVFEGAVVDGRNRRDPLMGQAIGDRDMAQSIRSARKSRRIKAVVFRINSPGGSAFAGENVLRELALLAEKKPLVISMGPVAGSGGYWISMTGSRLFACPTTITGSIGVITLFFNLRKYLDNHGITSDVVKRGDSADLGTPLRALTDEERAAIDRVIESLYREFVARVAQFRNKAPEYVDEIGEGRLWLGADAHARGLVDELGGIQDAIVYAQSLIKRKRVRVTFGPRVKRPLAARMLASRSETSLEALSRTVFGELPLEGLAPQPGLALSSAYACGAIHGKPLLIDETLLALCATAPWLCTVPSPTE